MSFIWAIQLPTSSWLRVLCSASPIQQFKFIHLGSWSHSRCIPRNAKQLLSLSCMASRIWANLPSLHSRQLNLQSSLCILPVFMMGFMIFLTLHGAPCLLMNQQHAIHSFTNKNYTNQFSTTDTAFFNVDFVSFLFWSILPVIQKNRVATGHVGLEK